MSPESKNAIRFFFILMLLHWTNVARPQVGKDGARTISSANTVVNSYTRLTSNANAGATSIQVTDNALINSFSFSLAQGDLIFIIQLQGVSINTADDSTYGSITSYNNCGNHEFLEVASVAGTTTINLRCPLQHDYSAAGAVQVIRVPRLQTLNINSGGAITSPSWDGTTGGVVVIEVEGATTINSGGSIDVSGKGFRGGALLDNNSNWGVGNFRWPTNDFGAEKGESIAGYGPEYDLLGGRHCKGAPANGGGGANAHNAGGGGGSNAGNIVDYTGRGNPSLANVNWATAWDLEYTGFSASTSSGGGKGGYSFSASDQNALTAGPGDLSWGGDRRSECGGRGGHPLNHTTGRIFFGGGGGSGDQNDSRGGPGGNGGGIIYLMTYDVVNGAGQILANGANGASTLSANGTDGAGGGGGGGAVVINATGNISGISVIANGGSGGIQNVFLLTEEAEGPGGGGAGGFIALSGGVITRTTNGGNGGTTNSLSLSEFPPNGATAGGIGINFGTISSFRVLPQTISTCGGAVTLTATTQGTPPPGATYSWYDQPQGGTVLGTGISFTTPPLSSSTTYYVSSCPGYIRVPVQVNVSSTLAPAFSSNSVCVGTPMSFTASATGAITSWQWDFGDGSGTSGQQNPTYTYSNSGNYNVTLTVTDGTCTQSVTQTVNITALPVSSFTSSASGISCAPLAVTFSNLSTNATSYSWNFGDGSSPSTSANPSHTYAAPGSYTVTLTSSGNGCTGTSSEILILGPPPQASFQANASYCQGDTVFFVNNSSSTTPIISQSWNFGDGSPLSPVLSPSHFYANPGSYQVTLTVNTALCSSDTIIPVYISAGPQPSFSVPVTSSCGSLTATFNNTSAGPSTYFWDFGDGGTSTAQSPTHTYSNPGTYSVKLIATQGSCTDSVTQQNLIEVLGVPTSSFSAPVACAGTAVQFTNLSNGNGSPLTNYDWEFGDGATDNTASPAHTYTAPGSYTVKLTVGNSNCFDDTTIIVLVQSAPVIGFTGSALQGCDSLTVQFTNLTTGATSYSWQFGDGATSGSTSPSHYYGAPGNFTVSLTATSSSGCSVTRATFNMISVEESPSATISTSAQNICRGDCINFEALTSPGVTSWTWTFSNASPSTAAVFNPATICYPTVGDHDVTLEIKKGNCTSVISQSSMIHVVECSVLPNANFISSDTVICEGDCIDFVGLSTNSTSWQWAFPGGQPSTSIIEHPMNVCYASPGSHDVALVASNTSGSDTIYLPGFIIVKPAPATPTFTQNGDTLTSSPGQQYQWYYQSIELSGATSQQYIAQLSGPYSVSVTDANGCVASSSIQNISLTGIDEPGQRLLFHVYPNPTGNRLSVLLHSETPQKLSFIIFDAMGRNLINEQFSMFSTDETIHFDLSAFPAGMYVIQIQSDDRIWSRPVIRQ